MKVLCIIPARYESTRFPGKALAEIDGIPMVVRVAHNAAAAFGRESVVVATDDDRIYRAALTGGFAAVQLREYPKVEEDERELCPTGTDRVALAAIEVDRSDPIDPLETIIVNVQGDEPNVDAQAIRRVAWCKMMHHRDMFNEDGEQTIHNRVACAISYIADNEDPTDPDLVKVAFDDDNDLTEASRKDLLTPYRQVGLYAFSMMDLEAYAAAAPSVESASIEILRFHEIGIKVRVCNVPGEPVAVDRPQHIAKVEEQLRMRREGAKI